MGYFLPTSTGERRISASNSRIKHPCVVCSQLPLGQPDWTSPQFLLLPNQDLERSAAYNILDELYRSGETYDEHSHGGRYHAYFISVCFKCKHRKSGQWFWAKKKGPPPQWLLFFDFLFIWDCTCCSHSIAPLWQCKVLKLYCKQFLIGNLGFGFMSNFWILELAWILPAGAGEIPTFSSVNKWAFFYRVGCGNEFLHGIFSRLVLVAYLKSGAGRRHADFFHDVKTFSSEY